jgi:hypothetical protein
MPFPCNIRVNHGKTIFETYEPPCAVRASGFSVRSVIDACLIRWVAFPFKTLPPNGHLFASVYFIRPQRVFFQNPILRHGLLKASYIPDRNQRELRELVRYRRSLIQERSREHNRVQKVLEGANIKLASVVSDIMGLSSRDMLEAMIQGESDPEKLAGFARRTMKRKKDELELALRGNMTAHQRLMLKTMLTHIDFLNEQILELDMEVAKRLDP